MRFFAKANYDFLGARRRALVVVAALILPGLIMMLVRGINYSIEFTGGTRMQIELRQPADIADIRAALDAQGLRDAEIQQFGSAREYVIRARTAVEGSDTEDTQATTAAVRRGFDALVGADGYTVAQTAAASPRVSGELRQQAVLLILLSFVAVLIYLAFRFEWRFGVAAIIATLHDIVATIAFIALFRIEVSLFVVGALLSMVGYSLNDTIVILDRVRENVRKLPRVDFATILNRSVNETLPRTVFTGTTALGSLVALAVLGGDVVRPFALVMLFGVLVGTFSSVFISGPVLLYLERRWPGPEAHGVRQAKPASPRQAQPVG